MNNIFDLKNKKIVISGGAGYLGTEFSFAVSSVGAIPIILDQNGKALNSLKKKFTKKKLKGEFFQVDLFNEIELNKIISIVIKKHKAIDCLINLASYYSRETKNKKNLLFYKF